MDWLDQMVHLQSWIFGGCESNPYQLLLELNGIKTRESSIVFCFSFGGT